MTVISATIQILGPDRVVTKNEIKYVFKIFSKAASQVKINLVSV